MRKAFFVALLTCVLIVPGAARPQTYGGPSVLSSQTLGEGHTVFHGQVGFPGLGLSLWQGIADDVDVGGKFALNYGYEGLTGIPATPGVKVQGSVRVKLLQRGNLNFGLRVSPGFFLYFFDGYVQPGITVPVDFMLGIALARDVMLHAGIDFPFFLAMGSYPGGVLPIAVGGGLEYAVDRAVAVTFNLRAGPAALVTSDYPYNRRCEDAAGFPYRCGRATLTSAQFLVGLALRL